PLTFPTSFIERLVATTDCPDPVYPTGASEHSRDSGVHPADIFTLNVTNVPTSLNITMQKRDPFAPKMYVIGPDGVPLFDGSDAELPGESDQPDVGMRFLATLPGTYTLIATSDDSYGPDFGRARYALTIARPASCTPKPLVLPASGVLTKTGQLFGDWAKGCGVPSSNTSGGYFNPSGGADLYTFTGDAGDVISVSGDCDGFDCLHLLM